MRVQVESRLGLQMIEVTGSEVAGRIRYFYKTAAFGGSDEVNGGIE
jgi:hypothetical protein